ncbi:MAG TPA: hypothetical protein VLX58_01940 [Bryobacteraceae bacterium]|nr:hypothetical protein [Bryobacteraceae bacterium]
MDHRDYDAENGEAQLDALFHAYRQACPDPEPGAGFMPRLWQRIEARERVSFVFGRLARHVVTAALALSMLMAFAVIVRSRTAPLPPESYVEVLAEDHARQSLDYVEPVRMTPVADQAH